MADEPEPDAGRSVLRDRWDAEAYVASVCFKHGPPRLTGVELEWLVWPRQSGRLTAATLAAALGRYSPTSLDPHSPADPLPGGSLVTVEPGGQIELASPPFPELGELLSTTCADADTLHGVMSAAGLAVEGCAADADRPPVRLLEMPRYQAMEQSFDRIGPHGRSAMCSTAAVQVSLDAGEGSAIAARWAAAHALGPVLLAAFANSPR
ncbi:MAG: ergothioneine biosynthesis glutamate--cysteine ligase EgtA, partial [Pseudonocardiales bacterium]|nr:ergothioneine biosynthesis glutamate--cysteine ligase EgtA [Pseudonocardiales bacterium]